MRPDHPSILTSEKSTGVDWLHGINQSSSRHPTAPGATPASSPAPRPPSTTGTSASTSGQPRHALYSLCEGIALCETVVELAGASPLAFLTANFIFATIPADIPCFTLNTRP